VVGLGHLAAVLADEGGIALDGPLNLLFREVRVQYADGFIAFQYFLLPGYSPRSAGRSGRREQGVVDAPVLGLKYEEHYLAYMKRGCKFGRRQRI
jgi:hypothetical protein